MAEILYRYTVEAMERSVRGGCKPDQFLGRPTKERPKTGDGFTRACYPILRVEKQGLFLLPDKCWFFRSLL